MKLQNSHKCGHTWRLLKVDKKWREIFAICERADWSLYGPFKTGKLNCSNFSHWSGREENSQ